MKSIARLLEMEEKSLPLTPQEKQMLASYRRNKQLRHSSHFIYHARKLPKEGDHEGVS